MVHESGLEFTIASVIYAIKQNIKGVFVEFGVWKGGASILMLIAQKEFFGKIERPVLMFDSFKGLPPVTIEDGPLAYTWQKRKNFQYNNNCYVSRRELEKNIKKFNFKEGDYVIYEGNFKETIPLAKIDFLGLQNISFLRFDGDWYESTKSVLEGCMEDVSEEAIVVLDDYYAWDGCARAVHEYFFKSNKPYRIKSLPYCYAAYFIKRNYNRSL